MKFKNFIIRHLKTIIPLLICVNALYENADSAVITLDNHNFV
jgi:hypothetical protein